MSDITNQATADKVEYLIAQLQQTTQDTTEIKGDVLAIVSAASPIQFFDDYDAANEDLINIPPDGLIEIARDETRDGARTRYFKRGADLSFAVNLDQLRLDMTQPSGIEPVGGFDSYNRVRIYRGNATRINVKDATGVHAWVRRGGADDNGGTRLVDALDRSWERDFFGFVLPEWFEGYGTGEVNSIAAIQAAVDASKYVALHQKYRADDTLRLKAETVIYSFGAEIVVSNPALAAIYADNVDDWAIVGRLTLSVAGVSEAPALRVEAACGIAVSDCLGFNISGVTSKYFAGSGLYFTSSSPTSRSANSAGMVTNCRSYKNHVGFTARPGFASEYISFTGCIGHYNRTYGMEDFAGNIQWTGGQLTHNAIGSFVGAGFNDAHGNMTGVLINHNSVAPVHVVGTDGGFVYSGCNIFDNNEGPLLGAILLQSCSGVVFSGCQIMADISSINATGINKFVGCTWAKAAGRVYQMYVEPSQFSAPLLIDCTRAGGEELGMLNAPGISGGRFRSTADQLIAAGQTKAVLFQSPDIAYGAIQFAPTEGKINIFYGGVYEFKFSIQTTAAPAFVTLATSTGASHTLPAVANSAGRFESSGSVELVLSRGDSVSLSVSAGAAVTVLSGGVISANKKM